MKKRILIALVLCVAAAAVLLLPKSQGTLIDLTQFGPSGEYVVRDANPRVAPSWSFAPALSIIGGREVDAALYPGQVTITIAITENTSSSCEGSLIDPYHIVTAAHCVDGDKVRFEAKGADWWRYGFEAVKFSGHQDGTATPSDVAVIRLVEPVTGVAYARFASWSETADMVTSGAKLTAIGRGTTKADATGVRDLSASLKAASVIVDTVDPLLISVRPGDGAPCLGDSGGMLTDNDGRGIVFGILSGVTGDNGTCVGDYRAHYRPVATFIAPWVYRAVATRWGG